MSLFASKPKDPIEEEMRRLKARERELQRKLEQLQSPDDVETSTGPSGPLVVIPPEEQQNTDHAAQRGSNGPRLRVQERRLRKQAIIACVALAILVLIIYRVWHG